MVYRSINYCLFVLVFFLSCSQDKLIVPNSGCIYRITLNGGVLDEFEYDQSNRCITIKGSSHYPGTVSYDKGKVSRIVIPINFGGGTTLDMIYDVKFTGKNSASIIFNEIPPFKPRTVNTFSFENNLVSRASYYERGYDLNGTGPSTTTTLELFTYDSSDNLIKKETLLEGTLIRVVEYENYDSKTNPFYADAMNWKIIGAMWKLHLSHPEMPVCKNNPQIIKQTLFTYSGSSITSKVMTTDSVFYKYNQNNLPVEINVSGTKYYPVKIEYKE